MVRFRPWVAVVAPIRRSGRPVRDPGPDLGAIGVGDRRDGADPAVTGRCCTGPVITAGSWRSRGRPGAHPAPGERSSKASGSGRYPASIRTLPAITTWRRPPVNGLRVTGGTLLHGTAEGGPTGDRRTGAVPAVGGRCCTDSVITAVGPMPPGRIDRGTSGARFALLTPTQRDRRPIVSALVGVVMRRCEQSKASPERTPTSRRRGGVRRCAGAGARPGRRCRGRAPAPRCPHRSGRSRRPGRTPRPSRPRGRASTRRPTRPRRRRTRT